MWNVFEYPWLLLFAAGVSLIVVSILRQAKPEWRFRLLLIPLGLAGFAFGLDAAVRTDYEAISSVILSCKKAAAHANPGAIMYHISPDYSDSLHTGKGALESRLKYIITNASIKKIKTQSHTILIHNDNTAESTLQVVVHLNKDSRYAAAGSIVFVTMQFDYEKLQKEWFIKSAEVKSVNNDPMNWRNIP